MVALHRFTLLTASLAMAPFLSFPSLSTLAGSPGATLASVPPAAYSAAKQTPKKPPKGQPTGVRGDESACPKDVAIVQTLLFKDAVDQTVSSQPTFFWYLSHHAPMNVRFRLVDPDQDDPVFVKVLVKPKAGLNQITLPTSVTLQPGRVYRWSVTLLCSPNEGDPRNPITVAKIKYVTPPSALTQQLATVKANRDRAAIYAQQRFWVDALMAIAQTYSQNRADPQAQQEWFSLLDRMGYPHLVQMEQGK